MTKEEAINYLKYLKIIGFSENKINEIVKALEQEPCEDCVSRQAVLDKAYAYGNGLEPEGYCVNVEDIQALPPIQPKAKLSKWKPMDLTYGRSIYYCTACMKSEDVPTVMGKPSFNYCPNCGAKMEVEK